MKLLFYLFMLNFCVMFMKNYLFIFLGNLMFMILFIMLFFVNNNGYWMLIYSNLGLDKFSYCLILLSLWIISMMYFVSKIDSNIKLYSLVILALMIILFLSFASMNLLMFYLFFEISLIPVFMLIMGWGYQYERINASMYMLIYTLFFSLPMMVLIYMFYLMFNSLSFFMLLKMMMNLDYWVYMIYFFMYMVFMVKLPLFLVHIWLPKAHVEAPVAGSMILAGVMLKLGGYGLMRMMMLMLMSITLNMLFMELGMVGMLLLSLLCLRQYDLKKLVAYSSVVHMMMMMMGLFSMTFWGYLGGYFMMVGHGLCSSGLFILVNYMYMRSKSRNILVNKGLVYFMPSMMMFWFLFVMNNMAAPISLNLLSEIMIIAILLNWSQNILFLLILLMFFGACYNLYMYSYSYHGMYSNMLLKIFNNNILEFYVMLFHFIPLNLLILKINYII
uniref:NADH-ubiquinone oxidoreductase chain 4 n=1 Tax=Aenasius arizonensis TaxID=2058190 RepID=A0A6B9XRE5_9HYME|nr:NADH dehydrogenase subunit 4 [Aenasius arizonensis]QHR84897.1 NADH dehydrogenase subunit 4 [Aenasius arizonensis]